MNNKGHPKPDTPDTRTSTRCPTTGRQVAPDTWKYFFIPNGRIGWWYCPICYGWHVLVKTDNE